MADCYLDSAPSFRGCGGGGGPSLQGHYHRVNAHDTGPTHCHSVGRSGGRADMLGRCGVESSIGGKDSDQVDDRTRRDAATRGWAALTRLTPSRGKFKALSGKGPSYPPSSHPKSPSRGVSSNARNP